MGAMAAGCTPVWAIESDESIADVHALNLPGHIYRAKVQDVDPRTVHRPDILCASPVCKSFSIAKSGAVETAEDMSAAESVCDFLRVLKPEGFLLENVIGYRTSKSMNAIRATLGELGYWWNEDVLNSADFGVPQTRRRFIVRAVQSGFLPPLPSPSRWVGWYEAIEDLLPGLPESRFAQWQLDRLPKDWNGSALVEMMNTAREATLRVASDPSYTITANSGRRPASMPHAFLHGNGTRSAPVPAACPADTVTSNSNQTGLWAFLMEGDAAGERCPTRSVGQEPAYTLKADGGGRVHRAFLVDCQNSGNPDADGNRGLTIRQSAQPCHTITGTQTKRTVRAWLEEGRVVSMSCRALARFQSFPDSYTLPDKVSLACRIVGNAFPPLMAKVCIESLMEAIS